MDFQRAFGSVSDIPRLEHRDMYQHSGTLGGANANEGECYFDLSDRIDLKTFAQPVLVSTTINLHALAAVRPVQKTLILQRNARLAIQSERWRCER